MGVHDLSDVRDRALAIVLNALLQHVGLSTLKLIPARLTLFNLLLLLLNIAPLSMAKQSCTLLLLMKGARKCRLAVW